MKLDTIATVAALGVIGWIGYSEIKKRRPKAAEALPPALTQPGTVDNWDLMPPPDWVTARSVPPTNTAVGQLTPAGVIQLQAQIPQVGVSLRRALVQ